MSHHQVVIEHGYLKIPLQIDGDIATDKKVILYLHGNNTSIANQSLAIEMLRQATGLTIVSVEYSGMGKNETAAYEESMPMMHVLESIIAYDWLAKKVPEDDIIVYGTSYGGTMAAALTKWRHPGAVIVYAPTVVPQKDMFSSRAQKPSFSGEINQQSRDEATKTVQQASFESNVPMLILKSANDELVKAHVVDAWKTVFPSAIMIELRTTGHSVRRSTKEGQQEWINAIRDFLDV